MGFDDFQVRKYCGIRNGKIIYKDDSGTVQEKKSVSGILTDVFVKKDGRFGPELHIVLYDDCFYHLQMFLNSKYARSFLCMLKSIAPAQPLTIKPTEYQEDGKKIQSLFLYQEGGPVKWYYKKDTNGLPPPEPDILQDKDGKPYEGWNYTIQTEFLLRAMEEFKPLLMPNKVRQRNENMSAQGKPGAAAPQQWKPDENINNQFEDDLPF